MDDKTKGAISGKTPARELAELAYYEEPRTEGDSKTIITFDKLTEEESERYIKQARAFLIRLNKLNMMIVPITQIQQRVENDKKNLELLTRIIDSFVKGLNTTKPALFPSAELAHRILNPRPEPSRESASRPSSPAI